MFDAIFEAIENIKQVLAFRDFILGLMEGEAPSTHGEVRGRTLTIEYSVSPDDTAGEYAFYVCH